MIGIVSFIAKVLCTTIGLSLLMLILWQNRRHRDNLLMAFYLTTMCFAQGTNAWIDIQILLNHVDLKYSFYTVAVGLAFNGYAILLLAVQYANLWRKRLTRLYLGGAAAVILGTIPFLYYGKVVEYFPNPIDPFAYQYFLTTWGYAILALIYSFYIGAVVILWKYRRGRAGNLLPGGVIAISSMLLSILPLFRETPLDVIAMAVASILLARAILNEKLFTPLIELNQSLTSANEHLLNLKESAEARAEQLATLNRVTQALTSLHNLPEILQTVAVEMVHIFNARHTGIAVLNKARTELVVAADYSSSPDDPVVVGVIKFRLSEYELSRYVIETGHTVVIADAQNDPRTEPIRNIMRQRQTFSLMITPLRTRGEVIGTIGIDLDEPLRGFTTTEVELAETIAGQIAGAIENARLFEQMESAKESAETANRAKSTFLANMSHELRTPLNAIIGYSEMLIEEANDADQPDFIPDLQKIQTSGKHLLSLINDILDLSKIEAGKMQLYIENFSLKNLVREVVNTVQPLMTKNGNEFKLAIPEQLGEMRADQTKVRQCLLNLLNNAAKFTQDGKISLEVMMESGNPGSDGAGTVVFRVTDNGIGMSSEQLEKLFQPFTQADSSTTRKFGGSGLGLVITRHFCRMMSGDVNVTSELGKGSCFVVRLPLQVAESLASESETPKTERVLASSSTILVIDGDAVTRDILQRTLRKEGFRVVAAMSGEEGLRLARALSPDVITLDAVMPGMDSWSVLSTIKNDPEIADIPVIMLTVVDDQSLGYILGAADYLGKPVDRDRLIGLINHYRLSASSTQPVLVIDDEADLRVVTKRILAKEGFKVIEAENGRQGLERVFSDKPQLILLDLSMPDMNGFEFVTELRRSVVGQSIPVIVITAKELTDDEHTQLLSKVDKVMFKSKYQPDDLLNDICKLVSARTAERSRRRILQIAED